MFDLGEENIGIEQTVLEPFCAREPASMVATTHYSHKVAIGSLMNSYRNSFERSPERNISQHNILKCWLYEEKCENPRRKK